jgi:hypothetical protein
MNSEPNQPRERRSGGLEEQLRGVLRKKAEVGFDSFIVSQDGLMNSKALCRNGDRFAVFAVECRCEPPVLGNLFPNCCLSLGMRPPTQIP